MRPRRLRPKRHRRAAEREGKGCAWTYSSRTPLIARFIGASARPLHSVDEIERRSTSARHRCCVTLLAFILAVPVVLLFRRQSAMHILPGYRSGKMTATRSATCKGPRTTIAGLRTNVVSFHGTVASIDADAMEFTVETPGPYFKTVLPARRNWPNCDFFRTAAACALQECESTAAHAISRILLHGGGLDSRTISA